MSRLHMLTLNISRRARSSRRPRPSACSDGGPSGAEGLASWCACRELIRVRCASMLRLARLLAVIM